MKKLALALAACVAGIASGAVPAPWTPVTAKDGIVSTWGRTFAFASNALPVRVTSAGRDLLAGPMRIVCADGKGEEIVWKKGGSWVQEATRRTS